ncbi:MAG TPA: SRPBCC family protein [Bryobacteraceae bacterium]|nr:SRPBCC family protein [Bryobacteraceae bacterium]
MTRSTHAILALACALTATPQWLAAEVLDSSAAGFTMRETVEIQAAPQDVYAKIFRVGEWWNPVHTFSHDTHNLIMEQKAGGCFCEKLPNGGGVKHMEVVNFSPAKTIVLHGAMGPMQTMAVSGSMQIQLSPSNGGTKVEVTYAVAGYLPAGLTTWATIVDGVIKDQFTRLKNDIEKGDPAAK